MSQDFGNSALDEGNHAFVEQYGEELLKLLKPKAGEQILDLGCGTGQLTAIIAKSGALVQGIDSCELTIRGARDKYPRINFSVADARSFKVEEPLDAVFSHAVLHLIKKLDAVINCVEQALNPGGRFVAEFNWEGHVGAIVCAHLSVVLSEISGQEPEALNPWYCPSIGEYTGLLEKQGFDVRYALLFARPAPLSGREGLKTWIEDFVDKFLPGWSDQVGSPEVINSVEKRYHDGNGIAEHRIIRVVAVKNS
jgi:trans-aconitate 2-methyltransferase